MNIKQRMVLGERNTPQALDILEKFFVARGAIVWGLWKSDGDTDAVQKIDFVAHVISLDRNDLLERFISWRCRPDFHYFFDQDCTIWVSA